MCYVTAVVLLLPSSIAPDATAGLPPAAVEPRAGGSGASLLAAQPTRSLLGESACPRTYGRSTRNDGRSWLPSSHSHPRVYRLSALAKVPDQRWVVPITPTRHPQEGPTSSARTDEPLRADRPSECVSQQLPYAPREKRQIAGLPRINLRCPLFSRQDLRHRLLSPIKPIITVAGEEWKLFQVVT